MCYKQSIGYHVEAVTTNKRTMMYRVSCLIGILLCVLQVAPLVSVSKGQPVYSFDNTTNRLSDLFNLKNGESRFKRQHSAINCGYSSCPETSPDKLNVHIVAHTHDDVGWLKTVDQYYYGTRNIYSRAGVQFILDSLIPQLLMDREKRFVYVEMSFFAKWWTEQDDEMKNAVRGLVNEGRLEFINGGWCMNDEATVNYHSTIEQMTLGFKFLNESFGQCGHPKVGWQIDPFGHSNEQASLFAQFGFDGMYVYRISYSIKSELIRTKSLDLIWHGDRALPPQSGSIFTNVFYGAYDSPSGFCFDVLCQDDAIVDNKDSYEYNIVEKGQALIKYIRDFAESKLTNHIMIPFGGDFQYSAAGQNFKSIDRLIKYITKNASDINIFYSTPSCYHYGLYNSVHENNIKLPEKYDDFMPYESSPSVWWSGYFSSRPSVKLIERETANLLQVSRTISLASLLEDATSSTNKRTYQRSTKISPDQVIAHEQECLKPLWEILGDMQHHDAVTGTEKQHVADDYVRRTSAASKSCVKFIGHHGRRRFNKLMDKSSPAYEQSALSGRKLHLDPIYLEETSFCPLNISQCEPLEIPVDPCHYQSKIEKLDPLLCLRSNTYRLASLRRNKAIPKEVERKGVLVTAYNPLAIEAKNVDIRLPCIGRCDLDKIQVIHVATNETIKISRLPLPSGVESLTFRNSLTNYEFLFYANVPALGATSFVITDTNDDDVIDDETVVSEPERRMKRSHSEKNAASDCDHCEQYANQPYEYISMPIGFGSNIEKDESVDENTKRQTGNRHKREDSPAKGGIVLDRVVVKFDMQTGMIIGLKRVSDGSYLNITQKFGTYLPSNSIHPAGAYIFRPSTREPTLLHKPITFKMIRRNNGSLIEILQKWSDWIWQTIRVDGKKNYIEFDYVVGPIPFSHEIGYEVVTRYITNLQNQGIFFTDSNGRQMLPRTKSAALSAEQLGGSFYPVVSSMLIRSLKSFDSNLTKINDQTAPSSSDKSAEAVAILVDRPQAGTSLNDGNLEFLVHRRLMVDDKFGVGEPLSEPGEDGRGLVTRGRHRLYLKFPDSDHKNPPSSPQEESRQMLDTSSQKRSVTKVYKLPRTPRANVTYALGMSPDVMANSSNKALRNNESDVYIVHDQLLNDLRQESTKFAFKPLLTFDRLRVPAREFVEILRNSDKAEFSLLNNSLPNHIHLLTVQPWSRKPNELLLRLENLDNPLTLTRFPSKVVFTKLLNTYRSIAASMSSEDEELATNKTRECVDPLRPETKIDIEHLFKSIRIVSVEEYNLGANVLLNNDKRLDWTQERNDRNDGCNHSDDNKASTITLSPRQIRTFLATYEFI